MTQFEKTYHFMKKPWVIVFYAILVILAYHYIDRNLATYFHHLDLRTHMHLLSMLTVLGQWSIYVVFFILAGLFFRYIKLNAVNELRSWYLLGCVLVPDILCQVLKVVLGRARPDLLFASNYFGFYWFKLTVPYWSFPSGHTMTVVGLAAGLGVLLPRYFFAVLAVALLIAASRIVLYHHYLSDVMSAFYISLLVVGFWTYNLNKNNRLISTTERSKKLKE